MSDILSKFMNIWEVESHYKCTIAGAILSVEKHKSILKKCGYNVKAMKPYEYHQQIMAELSDENAVSRKVNNFIRSKSRKYMLKVAGLTDKKIISLWREYFETGSAGSMFYAIVSYEKTSIETLNNVYGEVHMQAHANMTEIFQIREKLLQVNEKLAREKRNIDGKNENLKAMFKTIKSDTKKMAGLETDNQKIKKRVRELEDMLNPVKKRDNTIQKLEHHIAAIEQHLKTKQQKIRVLEREKKALQIDYFSADNENKLLKDQFHSLVNGYKCCNTTNCPDNVSCNSQNTCPQYQLCAKKVFMVGGIIKLQPFYKDIVENAGGEFYYHDGFMKNTNTNFEAKVKRCDVVICPVNCNSHNACLKVKRLCKLYNKECKILRNSSLSAVSDALLVHQDETSINEIPQQ